MLTDTLPRLPAVILAGGLSRRMGQSKADVLLAGKPMLDHILDRLIPQASPLAINCNGEPLRSDLPCIADSMPDHPGPLAGIAAAMRFARNHGQASHVLTVPVDAPFIPDDLLVCLLAAVTTQDTVALARSGGRTHPVIGLWPVHLEKQIHAWLMERNNRKLMLFVESLNVVEVDFKNIETAIGPLDPFFNVNTPEDRLQAEHYLEALAP